MELISNLRNNEKLKKILSFVLMGLVLLYAFTVPSFGSRNTLNYIVYGVIALLGVVTVLFTILYSKIKFNLYTIILPIFLIPTIIGTLIYSKDYRGIITMFVLILSFYVLYYAFKAIDRKYIIFDMIVAGIFAFSIYYIIHYRNEIMNFSSFINDEFRLGTDFDNQNDVASYCVLGFSLSLYQILFDKRKIKYIFLLPFLTVLLVGITTGSRTFLLAIVLIFLLLLYFKMINHKFIYLIILALVVLLFIVLINLPFMATIKYRFEKLIITLFDTPDNNHGGTYDTSFISRAIWLDYGFYLGSKNILTGYGFGGFKIYSGVGTFTHSNFSEVLCDFGIIGFLSFYVPFVVLAVSSIKKKSVNIKFVLPMLIYYLLVGFSNVFYYNKFFFMFLAICYYLVYDNDTSLEQPTKFSYERVLFVISDSSNFDDYLKIRESFETAFPNAKYFNALLDGNIMANHEGISNAHYCGSVFSLFALFRKKKIDTVVTFGEDASLISDYAILSKKIVHIPVVGEKESQTIFKKRFYKIRPFISFRKGEENKYTHSVQFEEDFSKTVSLMEKGITVCENTFNW